MQLLFCIYIQSFPKLCMLLHLQYNPGVPTLQVHISQYLKHLYINVGDADIIEFSKVMAKTVTFYSLFILKLGHTQHILIYKSY